MRLKTGLFFLCFFYFCCFCKLAFIFLLCIFLFLNLEWCEGLGEDVVVKVRLEGETAKKFLELKELFGIVNNTEAIRVIINLAYSMRCSSQKGKKVVSDEQ